MNTKKSIGSGLVGALAVNAIHETLRRVTPDSPRMDLLGMQAITKVLTKNKVNPPSDKNLFLITLAGDLLTNTIYYSLTSTKKSKNIWVRGAVLGAAAGAGAILLPKPLGLKEEYSNKSTKTKVLTLGLYLLGGLVTAAVSDRLKKR